MAPIHENIRARKYFFDMLIANEYPLRSKVAINVDMIDVPEP